ncbi:MAG: ribosomal L7Ae/L30e/S12e/Gadd45 family protein [Candidatus Izemoplasmatales bacterium]|jgi:ribosomal protein L7Ae-like RNA K-turn-binding protein|nr:ribosomal L7Ae/L30e/S12e/Gadd45 family protein [Candidatus Izemoplasmatales bacterium]
MNKIKILSTLGLTMKAGLLISGEDMVLDAIRKSRARLVFLASDTGPTTIKRISDKTTFYQVPLISSLSSDELSRAIGKANRKVIAVIDTQLALLLQRTANE